MLRVLNDCGAVVYGVTEQERIGQRVPTLCFNLPNVPPARVTEELAKQNIGVRDGHMYSPRLMKRLGIHQREWRGQSIIGALQYGPRSASDSETVLAEIKELMLTDKQSSGDSLSLQYLPTQNLSQQLLPGTAIRCGAGRPGGIHCELARARLAVGAMGESV